MVNRDCFLELCVVSDIWRILPTMKCQGRTKITLIVLVVNSFKVLVVNSFYLILPLLWTSKKYSSLVSHVNTRLEDLTDKKTVTGVATTSVTFPPHSANKLAVVICVISTRISLVSTGTSLRSNLEHSNVTNKNGHNN